MALRLGVSLVTMNKPAILRRTLEALEPTLRTGTICMIVDNGSTDSETLQLLESQSQHTGWIVVRNPSNVGLSKAVNQGLAALAEYVDVLVHMDDDAVLESSPNWAHLMLEMFATCPEIGLLLPNAPNYTEFIPQASYHEIRWGLGMFWGLRRETYDLIGGYDPQLLHQNECDLALRVRMAGYTVGAVDTIKVIHNDPGRPAPDDSWRYTGVLPTLGQAREHIGVVQFRDKYTSLFLGPTHNYGTIPLSLMSHWPPDQEWYGRFAAAHGVNLNPEGPAAKLDLSPGHILGVTADNVAELPRQLRVGGQPYTLFVELRGDMTHWYHGDGYASDRQLAIDNWAKLTGERYEGYRWPNLLRPEGA